MVSQLTDEIIKTALRPSPAVHIKVKLFASLRERVGVDETELQLDSGATAADGWQAVTPLPMPDNLLLAVNLEYVNRQHALQDGDELAFFPPVTGG